MVDDYKTRRHGNPETSAVDPGAGDGFNPESVWAFIETKQGRRRMLPISRGIGFLILAAAPALTGAASAADFYGDKSITIVVGSDAGGSYDSFARLLAANMGRYIPGHPKFIVQNMPGAAGLKAANYVYNVAPRDGTVMAATFGATPTGTLLSQKGAQYDPRKANWLGSITTDPYVGFLWHAAPVQTWADFYTKQPTMGTQALGSSSADFAIVSNAVLGTKIKLILGYKSSGAVSLAMQRGEVMGNFATAYSSLRSSGGDLLREGKYKIFIQHGLSKIPDLPDVPLLIDQAKNDDDRRLLEIILARQETGKPYLLPPGVPADRVAILQSAFASTVKDSAFVAQVRQAHMDVTNPMTGAQVKALVDRVMSSPPALVARLRKIFDNFANSPR
jgi:tripartite-type tricarboxylate transporter receptor subunit TctC